jgi:CBS domain-containing protein
VQVRDVMKAPVHTVATDDTLNTAAKLMRDQAVGCIPVTDEGGALVGILTERDIVLAAFEIGDALWRMRVGTYMRTPVFVCRPGDSVESAAFLMRQHHVRRLPVIDEERRPLGLVSLDRALRAMCPQLSEEATTSEVQR